MKYLNALGLLAVTAAALAALAGTASATTITSPTGTAATPTIHLVNTSTHIRIASPLGTIECALTLEGTVQSHGAAATAEGNITRLDWTGCTNKWHLTTITGGSFLIHWTSGYNGILTFTGTKIFATRLGVTCVYETNSTSMGTVTGGNPATWTISASIPINASESSGLCGTGAANAEGILGSTSAFYIDP